MKVHPVLLARTLDILNDRKDRTTVEYFRHETGLMIDIKQNGVRNPVKLMPVSPIADTIEKYEGMFRVVCGQTRVNACRRANIPTVPAIILDPTLTRTQQTIEELADNNATNGFDTLALADFFVTLMRDNNWSIEQLCAEVPFFKPPTVCKALSIFKNLIQPLKDLLGKNEIGPRYAYYLSRLPQDQQLCTYELTKGMSVVAAEGRISAMLKGHEPKPKAITFKHKHVSIKVNPAEIDAAIQELSAAIAELKKRKAS